MSEPRPLVRVLGAAVVMIALAGLGREVTGLSGPVVGQFATRPVAAIAMLALVAALLRPERLVRVLAPGSVIALALATPVGLTGMSIESAGCLFAVAAAVVLLDRGRRLLAEALSLGAIVVAALALLANLYGVREALFQGDRVAMPSSSAVAMILLAATLLVTVPDGLARWIIYGNDPGAILQRRLLPFIFLLLPSLGALRLVADDEDWYDDRFGIAVNITIATAVLTAITLRLGFALHRVDDERARAADELLLLTKDLEHRVRVKAEELESARTRVALLSDRNRIARDLHDRVIQRIFAAGLQLTELPDSKRASAAVVDRVVDDLNDGIRELRETIFQLELRSEVDPARALAATAQRLEPILGFAPGLRVDGDVTRMGPALADHLLAVAHEALINIAKHARAGRADIRLLINDDGVSLTVGDDGCGFPETPDRESGVLNIRSRASEVDGTVTWSRVSPSGTQLEFVAPLTAASGRPEADQPGP